MPRKRSKSVSFDAMVKFFMQQYKIPTKRDIDQIMTRLDRLERMIEGVAAARPRAAAGGGRDRASRDKSSTTAADTVLAAIRTFKKGASFTDIQSRTGFGEKKLRNIIFRLNKTGKIKRISRGVYTA